MSRVGKKEIDLEGDFTATSTPLGVPDWADPKTSAGKGLPPDVRKRMMRARGAAKPKIQNHSFEFSFAELFAGIGGFHQGLKDVGGSCVYASEWDRFAAATYWAWTGQEVDTSDIREVDLSTIKKHDVLCAGFPCQPFSLAGVSKKNSLGRAHGFDDDLQGNLFFSVVKAAKINRPKVLLLENVRNLISHDNGNTLKRILDELDRAQYWCHYEVIDASGWIPQRRSRVFFVCFDKNTYNSSDVSNFTFPTPPQNGPVLSSILEEEVDDKYVISTHLWNYLREYKARHEAKGSGFGYGLFSGEDIARTISARYHKDGAEILIDRGGRKNPRRLTPREAGLLMGFTDTLANRSGFVDGFPQVVSDTQAYRQFGNSVSPLVVKAIGKKIKKYL